MASRCNRFMNKASISSLKSAFKSASVPKSAPSSPKFSLPTASPVPRFSISRCPSELGCVQSLLPLHNAVAAARLTSCLSTSSRSCRSLSQGTLCRTSPGL
ncbi:protein NONRESPONDING TO OXYLIPINS 2, mitochondrial-like isoform X1 [Bidens hawaiensis]|uniref:protein NONRESPONDING TO OXYLIPINS 2, mitochondrial-like isoform X1 n=2 Tax=Bidens hawaiensis TaxID=980011 RepID=UPI004049DDD0